MHMLRLHSVPWHGALAWWLNQNVAVGCAAPATAGSTTSRSGPITRGQPSRVGLLPAAIPMENP